MKIRFLMAALLSGVATLAGTFSAQAKEDSVTIGMAVAMSGWMEAYDGEATKMAQLWIEKTNADGGVLGKQIATVSADTKTDRVEGAKAGQSLIQQGANLLLVSADYDYGAPAALQAQKAGIISAFLGAADPKAGVLGVGPFAFTTIAAAQLEGATMGDWGFEKKGFRKGYELIDESIEYNKSICAGYKWAFAAKGEVIGADTFKGLDPVISSQITRMTDAIRTKGVDHIMLCSTNPGAASALRQIRAAGITLPVLSGTAMDGTYWLNAVPNLKDFYLPVQALPAGDARPAVEEITKAYTAKFGKPPTTQYAYPIYAWLDLWKAAVEKAGTTDAKPVVAELEKAKDAPTVLGPRSFTNKLHIQTDIPLLITSFAGDKQSFVEEWRVGKTIPDPVLYRLAGN
ncbi:hypothetical protein N825_09285 [Skermanella stibiiresistens SB22]|uniref:Leucine-binding protein domain-containing protein n=1 Tax=Skermanella stibiiresistens SB22 TaxID=1385369 RepID=W9H1Y4_9PROT|nr:ABC transporter substrate-binding protein [Skermanella stibiiresistens]EWY37763.1 hypothetical protein N825_09285 [Skermanella stibiiresistens SB22]